MLKREAKASRGVKLYKKNDALGIDLYIIVSYGVQIPQLAWQIQRTVKSYVKAGKRQTSFSSVAISLPPNPIFLQASCLLALQPSQL